MYFITPFHELLLLNVIVKIDWLIDWLIDCFTAHQHRKAINNNNNNNDIYIQRKLEQ